MTGLPPLAGWLPPADDPTWEARYANDLEGGKRTTRRLDALPAWVRGVFAALTAPAFVAGLSRAFGIDGLEPDPTLHGGGLHVTDPGGWLNCHLDYARHPTLPDRERRINAIVFLHPTWGPAWGGSLDLCDPGGSPVVRVDPRPGRLAVFETGDDSYHGVAPVAPHGWACPACGWANAGAFDPRYYDAGGGCSGCVGTDPAGYAAFRAGPHPAPRVSAAVYYLAPARPGVTRRRALFMPTRGKP